MLYANFILFLTIFFSVLIGCSGTKTPITSDSGSLSNLNDFPEETSLSFGAELDGKNIIAAYDVIIDPETETVSITPSNRAGSFHFPVLTLYPNVLQITGFSFLPNFWADIKLTHPFAGVIDAFDPRVIAIVPSKVGVSFYYPEMDIISNNTIVMEPDGYTKLFDNLSNLPGNANPFKSYFKDEPNRVWSTTGLSEETQRWYLDLDGFAGAVIFTLVVDVSTNYPSPATPITDNSAEPVEIEATIGSGLTSLGGSADVDIYILDWQGQAGIGGVIIESPALFSNTVSMTYVSPGPDPDQYYYAGTISNDLLAPDGEYGVLVGTWDSSTGIYLYDEFTALVEQEIVFNPADVTPEWWSEFDLNDIFVSGNYAYAIANGADIHIFDISTPSNPI